MNAKTDKTLLILTALFVGGLALVAGAISFDHMRALALIRSSQASMPVELGCCVVDMSTTGRVVLLSLIIVVTLLAGWAFAGSGSRLTATTRITPGGGDRYAQDHDG